MEAERVVGDCRDTTPPLPHLSGPSGPRPWECTSRPDVGQYSTTASQHIRMHDSPAPSYGAKRATHLGSHIQAIRGPIHDSPAPAIERATRATHLGMHIQAIRGPKTYEGAPTEIHDCAVYTQLNASATQRHHPNQLPPSRAEKKRVEAEENYVEGAVALIA